MAVFELGETSETLDYLGAPAVCYPPFARCHVLWIVSVGGPVLSP